MAVSPLRTWSLLSSIRLINTTDLRKLDGVAFRSGERCLDLRSATVMSDQGLHVMTIDELEFDPGDLDGMDMGALLNPLDEDALTDLPVRSPSGTLLHLPLALGDEKYGHLRLQARVYINPGFCPRNQAIIDYLSISFATWLRGPGQGFGAAEEYLQASGLPEALGRPLEVDVQPERAQTPEQGDTLKQFLADLEDGAPRDALDGYEEQFGNMDIPLSIQAGDIVDWTTYTPQLGTVSQVGGNPLFLHEPYDPSTVSAVRAANLFGPLANMKTALGNWERRPRTTWGGGDNA